MQNKTAVITGITGQDGSYLSEFLLAKNYRVIGVMRRASVDTTERLKGNPVELVEGDVTDYASMSGIIAKYQPDELYNLAAQSHVATSFEQPHLTFQVNAGGVLNILEAVRVHSPKTKVYQASTSEMFGNNYFGKLNHEKDKSIDDFNFERFQNETTPFAARSPYGAAKIAAHNLVQVYRDSYGLFACSGILFNHESPRRGDNFVTRKITKYVSSIYWQRNFFGKNRPEEKLYLGNLQAKRDWGFAGDYVEAMWLMLQQEKPEDFVIATGETHSVEEFLIEAFGLVGLDYRDYVVIDPKFYRPAEVNLLLGDAGKAKHKLGWSPKTSFKQLVKLMVDSDMQNAKKKD